MCIRDSSDRTDEEYDNDDLSDLIFCSSESEHDEDEDFFDENPSPTVQSWVLVEFEGRKSPSCHRKR